MWAFVLPVRPRPTIAAYATRWERLKVLSSSKSLKGPSNNCARLRREDLCATTALRGQGVGQVRALSGPTDRSSSDLAGPTCGPNPSGDFPRVTDVGQDKALALLREVSSRFALYYAGK